MIMLYLLCMSAHVLGSLATCDGDPIGECVSRAALPAEDVTVLLQKAIQASLPGAAAEEKLLEDDKDFDLEYDSDHDEQPTINASQEACRSCQYAAKHGPVHSAIWNHCKNKDQGKSGGRRRTKRSHHSGSHGGHSGGSHGGSGKSRGRSHGGGRGGKGKRHGKGRRGKGHMLIAQNNGQTPLKNCVTKLQILNCTAACDYGTPCERCTRSTPRGEAYKIKNECNANATAYMQSVCTDKCSASQRSSWGNIKRATLDFFDLRREHLNEFALTESHVEDTPNATQKKLQHYCNECLRKDHNQPLEKRCTRQFHGSKWWPFGVACVGNGILKKCKPLCSFTDECSNCQRYSIIRRDFWLVKHDALTCLHKGLAKRCGDKCANATGSERNANINLRLAEESMDSGHEEHLFEDESEDDEESMDSGHEERLHEDEDKDDEDESMHSGPEEQLFEDEDEDEDEYEEAEGDDDIAREGGNEDLMENGNWENLLEDDRGYTKEVEYGNTESAQHGVDIE